MLTTPVETQSLEADELLAALRQHQEAISRRWCEVATGQAPLVPGLTEAGDATERRPVVLSALMERLSQTDALARRRQADLIAQRWREAGLSAGQGAAYFFWLHQAVRDVLAAEAVPGEKAEALVRRLELESVALHDELVSAECGRLRRERDELDAQVEVLFEESPEAMLLVDLIRGAVGEANPAACELVGLTAGRLRTLELSDLVSGLTEEALRALLAETVDRGHATHEDLGLRRPEGAPIPANLTAVAVKRHGRLWALCALRPRGLGSSRNAETFFENVISALPIRLVVLDSDLRIIDANPAYYVVRGLAPTDVVGKHISEVFPTELLETAGLRDGLISVLEGGERIRWSGHRHATEGHEERMVNIRVDPCTGPDGRPAVLVTMEDITEQRRQLFERTMLQDITSELLGELDLPRLLHAILTGMTAGGAVGLGFNRAFLLLVDEEAGVLRAERAVGPESKEQASAIWTELSNRSRTLRDFLADYDRVPPPDRGPLRDLASQLVFPLTETEHLPMLAVARRETIHVFDAELDARVSPRLRELLGADEFVVAPLVAREKTIGAAIADNLFTARPIDQPSVQLLSALANQAALAIDRAEAFQRARQDAADLDRALHELRNAQEENLRNAQLAAVGEVTAMVAHEIRNPLAAIGGFARSIARQPERVDRNLRGATVIVEEVERLEAILGDLLDFTKPSEPALEWLDLAPVVRSVAETMRPQVDAARVEMVLDLQAPVPPLLADAKHVRQIMTNLIRNALEAMPEGGLLTLRLSCDRDTASVVVADNGQGIPRDRLPHIFDTFYTSKATGTGLGLALCQRLIRQHGGDISVESEAGAGARFTVQFPIPVEERAAEPAPG